MSSGARHAALGGTERDGVLGPRPRPRLSIIVLALAAAAVIAVLLGTGTGGGTGAARARNATYGAYPRWLPDTKLPSVDEIVRSTPTHPALEAIEGNTIDVWLGHAQALVTAVGPALPSWVSAAVQSGRLAEDTPVPTTFTVTVIAREGTVPIRATAFSVLTAGGQLVRPAVSAAGGGPAPGELRAGQHVNLTLRAKLVEGDGSMRWAPSGSRVLAGWLYQLELD